MVDKGVLYIDVFFFINLLMDYLLLWATGKLAGVKISYKRLMLAAGIGAAYSVVVVLLLKYQIGTSLIIKILISLLMVIIAYWPRGFKGAFYLIACFYLIAFAVGGAAIGGMYLTKDFNMLELFKTAQMTFVLPDRVSWFLVAIVAVLIIGKRGSKAVGKGLVQRLLRVPVVIKIGKNRACFHTLVDTGNCLSDPFTGKPVLVAELEAIKNLLPHELYVALEGEENELDLNLVDCLLSSGNAFRFRMIPFTSLGKKKGMLPGIRADSVYVVYNDRTIKLKDGIIGIYNQRLSTDGLYRGLLHPEFLQTALDI
jgi:stage II sporulation protein GA (sporulation sigma-E factor processing peptidase)